MEFLAEWGLEIVLGLISTAIMGYAKWQGDKLKKQLADANKYAEQQAQEKIEITIDEHLEPIVQELEDLRAYVRENENVMKTHRNLILASYRFRLMQLCKLYLSQQYITTAQLEQLTEFYRVYAGMGGNGQGETMYNKVMALPVRVVNDPAIDPQPQA